jgi:hypothetical protein
MADEPSKAERTVRALPRGTHVEVRSGFDDSWQQGFVIHEVRTDSYVLRRESDGRLLPDIARDRVRRPRSRQTWWV